MTDARSLDDLPYVEWTEGTAVKRIYADVWLSEQVSATATITVHAVESGSKVNDHYLPDQLTAKASLFISGSPIRGDLDPDYKGSFQSVPFVRPNYPNNTPLLSPGGLLNAAEGLASSAASALGIGGSKDPLPDHLTVFAFNQDPRGRLRKVFEQLLTLRQNATLVTVGFSQGPIENLAISSISLARTSDDGDSGTIELEFQQMNFVSTQSAAAIPIPKEPRARPKSDSITVSAKDATEGDNSMLKSLKNKGMAALGG